VTRHHLIAIVVAAFAMLPAFAGDYWIYILTLTGTYGIVALGLNLLTGWSGQISLGHAGFFAIGAYVSTIATTRYGLPFALALVIAVAMGWLLGLLVGFPAVRLKGLYLAIATMAFGIGVERALYHFKGLTGGAYGLTVPSPTLFGLAVNTPVRMYWLVLAVAAITIVFVTNIARSQPGRMLVAMRDSELAAISMGINAARLKVLAFAASAALAALGGVLYATVLAFISLEHFTLWLSITFISMIVVGGLGSVLGSFLGAAFVVVVPELLRGLGSYHQIIYGLAMILVFMFWPAGLAGLGKLLGDKLPFRKRPPGAPASTTPPAAHKV